MRGRFVFQLPGRRRPVTRWNLLPQEGQKAAAEALFQNVTTDWPATLYAGLCNQTPENTTVLADVTSEPTIGTGSYARQSIARNATDWATIELVNNYYVTRTKLLTFTASGADFDAAFTRAFVCTVSTGTAGKLISMSGALTEAVTVADGESFTLYYEVFLVAP